MLDISPHPNIRSVTEDSFSEFINWYIPLFPVFNLVNGIYIIKIIKYMNRSHQKKSIILSSLSSNLKIYFHLVPFSFFPIFTIEELPPLLSKAKLPYGFWNFCLSQAFIPSLSSFYIFWNIPFRFPIFYFTPYSTNINIFLASYFFPVTDLALYAS